MTSENFGIDIVNIARIGRLYEKFGYKFLDRFCNSCEISYIKDKNYKDQTIASIYAMKEAASKAYGTGIGKALSFKDIEISYDKAGRPYGKIKNRNLSLSASHDGKYCIGFAHMQGSHIDIGDKVLELHQKLKKDNTTHKGTMGKVMVIGSSKGMVGSGYLSSMAALRTGSGLVYHYVDPKDEIMDILSIKHTEVIIRDNDPLDDIDLMDGILFGPGIGKKEYNTYLLKKLLNSDIDIVIDADGLNTLADNLSLLENKTCRLILTPHVKEFERLVGKKIDKDEIFEEADGFAREYDLDLVLKDYRTYITNSKTCHLVDRPNSALSTPGSGDVLAGIIVSLIGQGLDSYQASILGVYLHSMAGQVSATRNSKASTIATDLIDSLKYVFKELEILNES